LPRIAKGHRPEFYDDPAIDQLFAIVTALTGELSVLSDRLDTVERLLADARVLSTEAIEAYVPDGAAAAVRAERRDELLRRVFAVLESYAAREQPAIKQPASKHAAAKPPASKYAAGTNAVRKPTVRKQVVRAP
jgi:hypothetical protein